MQENKKEKSISNEKKGEIMTHFLLEGPCRLHVPIFKM